MVAPEGGPGEWVLLTYRLPREPSTPRSAVWRRLRRLGVAQLSDGLVALPADARTREQLEWIADQVREADGTAAVWLARPASAAHEREIAVDMAAARAGEYVPLREHAERVHADVSLSEPDRARAVRRLRADLHRIRRRDYFPPPERDLALAAIDALARSVATPTGAATRHAALPVGEGQRR
ncbi:MAG TPA: Chromate resistance protein ChrB [Actinomycetes bacterium]|nr:Chromate resistance protein ChrB [Actinomycetes bacterium]